jgi:hypothetical protein
MRTVTKEELKDILQKHEDWLHGIENPSLARADLRDADLHDADLTDASLDGADLSRSYLSIACLTRADLRDAYLSDANLSHANLNVANLRRANLSGANLRCANLSNADLSHANLSGANLSNADLRYADLSHANLNGADLSYTNLRGANLSATCISPNIVRLQRKFSRQCPPVTTGGRVVFRTIRSKDISSTEYIPGHTYTAPHLSFDYATACHPGIYAASLEWMQANCPNEPLVKCYVRDGDWVITAKGAIRCKKLRVLRYLDSE